jgi:hypothetical protein
MEPQPGTGRALSGTVNTEGRAAIHDHRPALSF